jgi:PAS domain S-box-containing protein
MQGKPNSASQSNPGPGTEASPLGESERHLRLLIQGVTDYALFMLDTEGLVVTWNVGAQRIKGYQADEIVGRHFSAFYRQADRDEGLPEHALRSAARDGRYEAEGWRVRRDGSEFWASVIIDPVYDDDGVLAGYAKITRDDTERRDTRLRLEEAREQLFHSQKIEALGQLTGGLAHDFNNILQGMLVSLQLAQRRMARNETDKARHLIDAGIEAGRRAAALTHRLLAFGRRQSLDPKPVDVNALAMSMEDMLRRSMGELVRIELQLANNLPQALCDHNQLESALLNLAINGRDAMPEGGTLTVRSEYLEFDSADQARAFDVEPGAFICLSVIDSGMGMPADVISRAFDPFFTTKPHGQGSGLGLSMVHGFAKQSGGGVTIHSEVGKGTQVRVCLPQAHGAFHREAAVEPAARVRARPASEFVLVVDDDDMIRDLVTQTLGEAGYHAVSAADATAALNIIHSGAAPALLLTDVGLPGMNGRQLADAAREARPRLKVLFMTGYAPAAALGNGALLEEGMAILAKPFDVNVLTEKVRTMLHGA